MNNMSFPVFVAIFIIGFILLWLFVAFIVRKAGKMPKDEILEADGQILSESGWGNAYINGVTMRNCIKLLKYESGYVIQQMESMGGGKLWMPKHGYEVVLHLPRRKVIIPEKKKITWENNSIILYGKLAKFIA